MAKSSRVKSKGKSKPAPKKKAKAKAKARAPIKAKAKAKPAAKAKAKAKKAAPAKKPPIKAARKPPVAKGAGNAGASAVDEGWDAVDTLAASSVHRTKVEQHVLHLYQSTLDPDARLPTVLAVDPNDFDLDPSPFYEALEDAFKVEDPSKHEFAGYGGTIEHTINFIAVRWKGGELKQSDDDPFE